MLRSSALALGLVLAACVPMAAPDVPVSTADLVSSSGAVLGTVRVFSEPTGVTLRIDAAGVPAGQHGVHVHATGRCDPPGFTGAGPHWNPGERKHGHRNPAGFHMGDLGNLGVGADGKLVAGLLVPQATVDALRDADGAALVLHAKADDEVTDPSGNSGDRIACAVL
jgi:superoxide dismutase, Cu-Zn family